MVTLSFLLLDQPIQSVYLTSLDIYLYIYIYLSINLSDNSSGGGSDIDLLFDFFCLFVCLFIICADIMITRLWLKFNTQQWKIQHNSSSNKVYMQTSTH